MTASECFVHIDNNIDPKHRDQFIVVRDINQTGSKECVVRHKAHPNYYLWFADGQIVERQDDKTVRPL